MKCNWILNDPPWNSGLIYLWLDHIISLIEMRWEFCWLCQCYNCTANANCSNLWVFKDNYGILWLLSLLALKFYRSSEILRSERLNVFRQFRYRGSFTSTQNYWIYWRLFPKCKIHFCKFFLEIHLHLTGSREFVIHQLVWILFTCMLNGD